MSCHSGIAEDETKKKKKRVLGEICTEIIQKCRGLRDVSAETTQIPMYRNLCTEIIQKCRGLRDVSAETTQIPMYRNLSTESTQTRELQRLSYIETQAPREKCAEYTVYTNPENVISTEYIRTGDTNTGTERTVTQRTQTQVLREQSHGEYKHRY